MRVIGRGRGIGGRRGCKRGVRGRPRGSGPGNYVEEVSDNVPAPCSLTRPQQLSFRPSGLSTLRGIHNLLFLSLTNI